MNPGSRLHFVLRNGDRVCFTGDSITAAGFYIKNVSTACARVYPGAKIRFFNCGNPGDATTDSLARFERDALATKPVKKMELI